MKFFSRIPFIIYIILILSNIVLADIPTTITYQARITDADHVGLTGYFDITFRLFDTATGGTPLWTETHTSTHIQRGLFSIVLGEDTPLDIDCSEQLYMEIEIDSDIMVPRIKLTSEFYALRAAVSDSIAGYHPEDDDLSDDQLANLGDVNVGTIEIGQTIVWDGSEWVPGSSGDADAYNTDLTYNSATATLSVTDGDGTLEADLNIRADSLQDNSIDELEDVEIDSPDYYNTLVYVADRWTNRGNPYNSGLHFNHTTNTFTITDGLSTQETTINDENDDLTDNILDHLGDVNVSSHPLAGRVLQYNGSEWIAGDPEADTDNQNDSEVFLTATSDFGIISDAVSVHDGLDDLDNAIGELDDGNPITTPITWYDLSAIPPGFDDGIDNVDDADNIVGNEFNSSLTWSDAADQLLLLDGGGALTVEIDNEAEDLTDNAIGEIGNVNEVGAIAGNILQFDGSNWIAQDQTDGLVNLSMTGDFELIGDESNLHGALVYLDEAIANLSDSDTLTTAIKWADIKSKPSCFADDIDNVDDADNDATNELITDIAWNEFTDELTISDNGDDNIIELTGFSQSDHVHSSHIDGDGIIGGEYDGSTEITWDILTGRGLEITDDSVRLNDDYYLGNAYDARFINVTDTAQGDIRGYFPNLTVRGIQGNPVTTDSPEFGSLMAWDGTEWNYTSASLMWGDSLNFIKPLSANACDVKIYDEADSFMIRALQSDVTSSGQWYGMKISREGFVSSKGYGIYSYAGASADMGADTTVSEFWGVYGKAAYGKRNYGLFGIANDVGIDCYGYGVYGEGQTAGGYFYGPDNDGEVATLKIQSGSQEMLIDGNEIHTNGGDIYLQSIEDNSVIIGDVSGSDIAKLHLLGGFAIGSESTVAGEYALDNCIQLATSVIGDPEGEPTYNQHTGALIYADLDGHWSNGKLKFHTASTWGEYYDEPSFEIGYEKSSFNSYLGVGTQEPTEKFQVHSDNNGTLDQENTSSGYVGSITATTPRWQSFTPSVSQYLVRFEIGMSSSTGSFIVTIREGEGTSGSVLTTFTHTRTSSETWENIEFDEPIFLEAESKYTIHLTTDAGWLGWYGGTNTYSRGRTEGSGDHQFKTYMSPVRDNNFVVTENCEVGIGTDSPEASLDVYGTVKLFGEPTEIDTGTVYYADTDGFIIATGVYVEQFIVMAGPSASLNYDDHCWLHDSYTSNSPKGISCPIPAGYHFKLIAHGSSLIWHNRVWMPMGKK